MREVELTYPNDPIHAWKMGINWESYLDPVPGVRVSLTMFDGLVKNPQSED